MEKENISYGFSSGHAQNTTVFWSWGWLVIRRNWMAIIAAAMIFSVALSRVYLGVHYVGDVIGGATIGVLFSLAAFKLSRAVSERFEDSFRFLNIAIPPIALILLLVSISIFPDLMRGDPSQALGPLIGFPVGVLLEMRYVNFGTDVRVSFKFLRAVTGFGLTALFFALVAFLPTEWIYASSLKFSFVSFGGAFIAPLIFKTFRI